MVHQRDSQNSRAKESPVLSITRMTVHNGPGIRTLVLFKGCSLRCLWCSTPESQKQEPEIAVFPDRCTRCGYCIPVCPVSAIHLTEETVYIDRSLCDSCGRCAEVCYPEALKLLGQPMTVAELIEEIQKDKAFYKHSGGGVTLSGGEPLLHPDFTGELLQALKKEDIGAGVDTCGHVTWKSIEKVLPYVDFFLWDVKHMDPTRHRKLTGAGNRLILDNVRAVAKAGVPIYMRVPVIPGHNDSEENIRATAELGRSLPSLVEVDLLPVHHLGKARYDSLDLPYPIADVPFVNDEMLQEMKRLVESYGLTCNIVG